MYYIQASPVIWDPVQITTVFQTIPLAAHEAGVRAAAAACAAKIGGRGNGALKRDVLQPKASAPGYAEIGSDLPYAAIEHFGGTIRAKNYPRMLIHSPLRNAQGRYQSRTVVASAVQVQHRAKRYLDPAEGVYNETVAATMERLI